jgi:signal transduction protein with GAF and PtsI domain
VVRILHKYVLDVYSEIAEDGEWGRRLGWQIARGGKLDILKGNVDILC